VLAETGAPLEPLVFVALAAIAAGALMLLIRTGGFAAARRRP